MSDGIKNRIVRAIFAHQKGDLEESLFQIAPAIDATSKKRYSKDKPGVRVRKFIKDEQDIIYELSTQYRFRVDPCSTILYTGLGEFQTIMYKYIRCAQSHDAEIDKNIITLGGDYGIGRMFINWETSILPPHQFIISKATVFALILSVVCAKENQSIDLTDFNFSLFPQYKLSLANLVGNRSILIKAYRDFYLSNANGLDNIKEPSP